MSAMSAEPTDDLAATTPAAADAATGHVPLGEIYETMREMSLQTDPQLMVRQYGDRMRRVFPDQHRVSLSRRGLEYPQYRVTRTSRWEDAGRYVDPWEQPEQTEVKSGGLLAELIYANQARVFDDLTLSEDDPAYEFFGDCRSLLAIPLLDEGEALNMVVFGRETARGFDHSRIPERFWLSNLFGRAAQSLVVSSKLRKAYAETDREMRTIAKIQRSLLPQQMPEIPGLNVAAYYETSQRAGGDYYDFFPLPAGRWGLLIADVSGHGASAAVVMAITRSIAHLYPCQSPDPGDLLAFLNQQLATQYTNQVEAFVTAFYAIFDPATRLLKYATAGHNPPRLWRCGGKRTDSLEEGGNLPLGLMPDLPYPLAETQLHPGDRLVMYTDGIVEAAAPNGDLFGTQRLDNLLMGACTLPPQGTIDQIMAAVNGFTHGQPAGDDRTMIVAEVV